MSKEPEKKMLQPDCPPPGGGSWRWVDGAWVEVFPPSSQDESSDQK